MVRVKVYILALLMGPCIPGLVYCDTNFYKPGVVINERMSLDDYNRLLRDGVDAFEETVDSGRDVRSVRQDRFNGYVAEKDGPNRSRPNRRNSRPAFSARAQGRYDREREWNSNPSQSFNARSFQRTVVDFRGAR